MISKMFMLFLLLKLRERHYTVPVYSVIKASLHLDLLVNIDLFNCKYSKPYILTKTFFDFFSIYREKIIVLPFFVPCEIAKQALLFCRFERFCVWRNR